MTEAERRAALAACVRRGSRPRALAKACLLIARGEYPRLDPTVSLAEIDRLAERVRDAMAAGVRAPHRALVDVLVKAEGFHGNVDDYDHPDNSYLNRVLAHRHGLPILLSILWIEVARGAGIAAAGIGLPGRFVIGVGRGRRARILDPFASGRVLTPDDAVGMAIDATGDPTLNAARLLVPATPREIMLRVLSNLGMSYERRGDVKRQIRVVSDQIALAEGDPALLARRGELRARLDDVRGGLEDLNRALARLPAGAAFDRVHERARCIARLTESEN